MKNQIIKGYNVIYFPEHPRAYKQGKHKGYVYEHVVIATNKYKRPINEWECVHHIDLNKLNNAESNLIVLSLSDHTRLHNIINNNPDIIIDYDNIDGFLKKCLESQQYYCLICNKMFLADNKKRKYCSLECSHKSRRKTERPDKEQLERDISDYNWTQLGIKYNVSDNAVRKWARSYQLI